LCGVVDARCHLLEVIAAGVVAVFRTGTMRTTWSGRVTSVDDVRPDDVFSLALEHRDGHHINRLGQNGQKLKLL
jgi:hypothetical protein